MRLIAATVRARIAALVLPAALACVRGVGGPTPGSPSATSAARATACQQLQPLLDSVHAEGRFPGATLGVAWPDGTTCALAVGLSDTAQRTRMRPDLLMPAGSVGKTYVAAVALQLVAEGKLRLDEPVVAYLGREPWFARLPNAASVTVRQLMNHTSGLVRYEYGDRFLRDLTANPDKSWTPEERLAYLFDARPPFAAGAGWEYSDTNYILLGMLVERLTGQPLFDEVRRRVTAPLGLAHTVPSDGRRIANLAQGYAGPGNPFGGTDAMVLPDGRFAVNPQFEWAGGGIAATAADLARWARLRFTSAVVPDSLTRQALDGRDASALLGPGARYGLGVIVRPTALGVSYGHSGFMPGYVTDVRYWPAHGVAVALQVNTSVRGALGRPSGEILARVARCAISRSSSGGSMQTALPDRCAAVGR